MASTIEQAGSKCFGCGACANACPQDAVSLKKNDDGFLFPSINIQMCINCGLCLTACPALGTSFAPKTMTPKCFAAFSNDKAALESSSGGLFSVLAEAVLDADGYVSGAAFDPDWSVAHKIISDASGLPELKTSKYLQSDIGLVFREIKGLLDDGKRVLFTGTPCQVAGLYGFLQKNYDNLLTADIFCHGVPSPGVWAAYIKEIANQRAITSIKFRDKKNGWQDFRLTITMEGKTAPDTFSLKLNDDVYMSGFLQNLYLRRSCITCKFSKTPRTADISMGDFWEYGRIDKQRDTSKGLSAVLLNTPKGETFFAAIKDTLQFLQPVSLESIIKGNPVLKEPCQPHKNHTAFFEDFAKLGPGGAMRHRGLGDVQEARPGSNPLAPSSYSNGSVISLIEKHLGRRNVGILNFSSCSDNNFGAVLVGYAMEKAVTKSGYFPYTINFIPKDLLFDKTEKNVFSVFREKFMHLTGACTNKEELKSYVAGLFNTFILGSDQIVRNIWHHDFIYYLDWVDGKKTLISYAASFGTPELGMQHDEKQYAEKCVRRFDAFSVREDSGAAIMKNEFAMDVPILPDPTLLLTADDYQPLIDAENPKQAEGDYVAYYLLEADSRILVDFADKYRLVNIYRNEDGNFRSVGEWLSTIKNAKYVITDSFHGAVFSIIFHKKFAAVGTEDRGNERLTTLMRITGLNRFFTGGELNESIFSDNIDYDAVERKLEVKRLEGYEYLKNSLNIPPNPKKPLSKRGIYCFRLFHIFPIFKIIQQPNKIRVRLFGLIPFLKIKYNKIYLFEFLLIGKIKIRGW